MDPSPLGVCCCVTVLKPLRPPVLPPGPPALCPRRPRRIEPVCSGLQAQILRCYRDHLQEVLLCSDLVKAYQHCVSAAHKVRARPALLPEPLGSWVREGRERVLESLCLFAKSDMLTSSLCAFCTVTVSSFQFPLSLPCSDVLPCRSHDCSQIAGLGKEGPGH